MDYREIVEKYGQGQLLRFESELSEEEKAGLHRQIESLDFSVLDNLGSKASDLRKGQITPLKAMTLKEIDARRDELEAEGIKAIKAGKVGAVLLAGGMGTRLGSDNPKGMFNIGINRELYIFECLINNLFDVVNKVGTHIPLYVMTSDLNYDSTTAFFKEHKNFGYPDEYVTFFKQEMAPACDNNGKVFLEAKDKVAVSPNGNGGWFLSMMRAGVLDKVKASGVEWLNLFAVDNVCQRICDPVFVGATILEGKTIGAKVVRKNDPDERVGVMCLEDGRPSIVEYYEQTDELRNTLDENGERVYNFGVILNYLFKVSELEEIVKTSLPYHVVDKKIPYINDAGELVKPGEPNGHKFEQLVLDMIHMGESCLPFEVVREREFAPVKNKEGVDSVVSARELLKLNGVEL